MRNLIAILLLFFVSISGCSSMRKISSSIGLGNNHRITDKKNISTKKAHPEEKIKEEAKLKGPIPKHQTAKESEAVRKPSEETAATKVGSGKGQEDRISLNKTGKEMEGNKEKKNKISRGATAGEKTYSVAFNFDDADIYEVIQIMLGEVLKVNYVIDPSVRGTVTIHTEGKLKRSEILSLIEAVFKLNNLALMQEGNLYHVVPISKVPRLATHVKKYSLIQKGGSALIEIIPVYNVDASSLAGVLSRFLSPNATLIAERHTNALLVSDTPENIAKIIHMVKILDVDVFSGMQFKLFPLQYMKVTDMANVLDKVFSSSIVKRPGTPPKVNFIPLETTNSLLVISDNGQYLSTIAKWIKELDTGGGQGMGIYIYPVENGNAEDIAGLLKQLYGEKAQATSKKVIVKAERKAPTKVATGELTGVVKIIPDKTNNLIIIKASATDYKIIKSVLQQLDIIPREVLIEVLIAEVSLNKSLKYGIEWYFKTKGINVGGDSYTGNLTLNNNTPLSSTEALGSANLPSGITYAIFNNANELRSLITALSSLSELNILSSPVILATDNQEASINVGQEVPIITQSVVNTSASNPNITNAVEYKDTGILLKVKPHINSNGLVSLDVSQEVSEAQPNTTSGINSPLFLKRKAVTHVIVQNGQTVVLGGLIQQTKSKVKSGVPFLKDIPVLGYLFGSTSLERKRTELMIAITPHVIRNQREAETVGREFRKKIDELKKILKGKR